MCAGNKETISRVVITLLIIITIIIIVKHGNILSYFSWLSVVILIIILIIIINHNINIIIPIILIVINRSHSSLPFIVATAAATARGSRGSLRLGVDRSHLSFPKRLQQLPGLF